MGRVRRQFDLLAEIPRLSRAARREAAEVAGRALSEQEDWIAPTLEAGFANAGGTDAVAGYYLDSVGEVHLKGTITVPASASGQLIFTLPEDYRPAEDRRFGCRQGSTDRAHIVVEADGQVRYSAATGSGSVSLDVITFRAEE